MGCVCVCFFFFGWQMYYILHPSLLSSVPYAWPGNVTRGYYYYIHPNICDLFLSIETSSLQSWSSSFQPSCCFFWILQLSWRMAREEDTYTPCLSSLNLLTFSCSLPLCLPFNYPQLWRFRKFSLTVRSKYTKPLTFFYEGVLTC